MTNAWMTYAWKDNINRDIDFAAQELTTAGVTIKLDRWTIHAGRRLWEQIEHFIQDPNECDAWILYATPTSLGSEACKEEFAYALDRALHSRGETFPVIGLFPASADRNLIPAGIRTRLHVSLTDADWKERIKAAAEGRAPSIAPLSIDPYFIKVHPAPTDWSWNHVIEVRPRAGIWSPFLAAIPIDEKDEVNPTLRHGGSNQIPYTSIMLDRGGHPSPDNRWWIVAAENQATPTLSYYICCKRLPSELKFGIFNGQQYLVSPRDLPP